MDTEEFWKGEFGDEYHKRQEITLKSNVEFFKNCLPFSLSILELGAGTGGNLKAIDCLLNDLGTKLYAVEINDTAAGKIEADAIHIGSIFDNPFKAELVLTKGLLIHIPPEQIQDAYSVIYDASDKYILICEYYNPIPMEVEYRGHSGKLWKRDFAGEMMDKYPDLKLIDYGFAYYRDEYPQDDITWFLLEK